MATLGGHYSHGEPAFTTCILKVNYRSSRWQKAVRGVLKSSLGVRSFRMDGNGLVEISGMVDPYVLMEKLRRAGRSAELYYWQFGQCSNNLFLPDEYGLHGYGNDGRYFPFRDTGVCGGSSHLYALGYDHHDMCHLPSAMHRPSSSSCEESISCCSIM